MPPTSEVASEGELAANAVATPPPPTLGHVAALDGLRGLAVAVVMLYHEGGIEGAGPMARRFGGGFLGVDLFFVLSGFLITSLLLGDYARRGHVISSGFWERRARRLLPALFVFLCITALYARFISEKYELTRVRTGALSTLFYVANFWMIRDPLASVKPLGHMWSLSIEEQFYLIWPLLLAGLVFLTRNRSLRLLASLVGLALVSGIAMAVWYTPGDPWPVYLATQTRAHGLLIGAALAVLVRHWNGPPTGRAAVALEAAGFAGLAFLVWAVFSVSFVDDWLYRGGLVLVGIAAAACIGAVMQPTSKRLRRVLSVKPLCAIGIISYGLYLYHIPIYFALTPERVHVSGIPLFVLRLLVTGLIATCSFFFIERPIRRNEWSLPKLRFTIPLAFAAMAGILILATVGATGVPNSAIAAISYRRQSATTPPGSVKVLVAGDSLAYSLSTNTGGAFTGNGIRGTTIASLGCALSPEPIFVPTVTLQPDYCRDLESSVRSAVASFKPDVSVLMAGPSELSDRRVHNRRLRFGTPALEQFLDKQLEQFRKMLHSGHVPLVLLTVPCLQPTERRSSVVPRSIEADPVRVVWLNDVWRRYAARHPGDVRLVNYSALLCSGKTGRANATLRPDGVTLGPVGAGATWRWLAPIAVELAHQQQAGRSK